MKFLFLLILSIFWMLLELIFCWLFDRFSMDFDNDFGLIFDRLIDWLIDVRSLPHIAKTIKKTCFFWFCYVVEVTCIKKIIETEANILQKTALPSMPQDGWIFEDFCSICYWFVVDFWLQDRSKIDQQTIEERRCSKMQPRWAKMAPSALQEGRCDALGLAFPSKIAPKWRP